MANGHVEGWCHWCGRRTLMQLRPDEFFMCWTGWYCDLCYDWIDIDEEHWRLFYLISMWDSRTTSNLARLVGAGLDDDPAIGRLLAELTMPS